MTDLTNGRARQSGDPMDSVSDVGEFPPNAKGRRTRRRRWYLFAVIPAMVLTIGVLLYSRGLCTMIGASSGIHIDLSSVLADASTPVHVHACVQSSCVSFTVEQMGSGGGEVCFADSCPLGRTWPEDSFQIHAPSAERNLWDPAGFPVVQVKDPSLSWLPITVRLNARDGAGNLIFDSSARVQPHMYQPNGPNCKPTVYGAAVVATRAGRLVPEP